MNEGSLGLELSEAELERRLAGLSPVKRRLLLARLKRQSPARPSAAEAAIPRLPRGREFPLSSAQERLWFLDQIEPGSAFYNISLAQRLGGRLEVGLLRRVIEALLARHESLRTVFSSHEGKPFQRIDPAPGDVLGVVDLSALGGPRAEDAALALASEEAGRPFDLARGPLVRFRLLRLAAEDHVLLLTLHHIIADGWSLGVLVREVGHLYRAFVAGEAASLPPLPIQYADFACWQRGKLEGGVLRQQLAWWKSRLTDLPELELPTDFPRTETPTYHGRRQFFRLPRGLTTGLGEVQQGRDGLTLFMVLLAGFQALLARRTGLHDAVVGSAIANRNRHEVEGLIGFFVNTLVMRTDLSDDPSFEDLLARVRSMSLAAFDHQDLPFERLVEELQPTRRLGRNPLFQVMFAVQNAPRSTLELPGLRLLPFGGSAETSKFDLQVDFWQQGEGLLAVFQYDTALFHATTIRRLAEHLWNLLGAALAQPQQPMSRHAVLSLAERHQLRAEWNDTVSPWPRSLLHQLVAHRARERPQAVALEQGSEVLRYGALDAEANRLAHHLRRLGVGEETLVGLFLERSPAMVVATLAILKAGGAYLPLDVDYPEERLAFMLADSGAPLVITRGDLRRRLPSAEHLAAALSVVDLAVDAAAIAGERADPPASARSVEGSTERLAYVMYTSGSTGRPKGVAVPHRAVLRLVGETSFAHFGADEVFLQFAPISFDASTLEIWGSLVHGARLVVMAAGKVSTEELGRVIAATGVSTLWLTAALFHQMVRLDPHHLVGVRQLLAGGDVLPVTAVETVLQTLPGTRLINGYGPTENTTFTCCQPILAGSRVRPSVPIGRPISATRAHVLDGVLAALPIGVAGDLFAAGDGLARGYLGRPGLTAERFLPDPFSPEGGGRLYATGDRVRHLEDGTLEFLGRRDHQVKVRGFRVETGEVETVLLEHQLVRDAAVVLRADEKGGQRLVAFVVAEAEAAEGDDVTATAAATATTTVTATATTTVTATATTTVTATATTTATATSAATATSTSTSTAAAEEARQQVDRWETLFEDTYQSDAVGVGFDISGWNSSYTGQPIAAGDMHQWLDDTVETILRASPAAPRRVLEIGCGTGLLLFRLLPQVEHYVASDFSAQALQSIRRQAAAGGVDLSAVDLRQRLADDVSGLEEGSFDAVIINSVIQYFPGVDYLAEVLEKALAVLAPGGFLFVGDVRSEPLLETFHASVEFFQAGEELSLVDVARRAELARVQETELTVAPAFFAALAGASERVDRWQIVPKGGRAHNEMTLFRYAAVLHVGAATPQVEVPTWLDWTEEELTLATLRDLLTTSQPPALGLAQVPNARLLEAAWVGQALADLDIDGQQTVADLRRLVTVRRRSAAGVELEDLRQLASAAGYRFEVSWARQEEVGAAVAFDVALLRRTGAASAHPVAASAHPVAVNFPPLSLPPAAWASRRQWANDPLQGGLVRRVVPLLRRDLALRLPEPMVPSVFVLLPALPLSPNGKVDRRALGRKALAASDLARVALESTFVAPRSAAERGVAAIWQEVLGLRQVGVEDDFFELGGHSLLATQVLSRLRDSLAVDLPLRALFESPTVADLARRLEDEPDADRQLPPPLVAGPRQGGLALSFAQERLWFLHQLRPHSAYYNEPLVVPLDGPLEVAALAASLSALSERHQVLRTGFPEVAGRPVQVIAPPAPLPLPWVDLSALGASAEEVARRLGEGWAERPFDLSRGPLLRALLLCLGAQRHRLILVLHHIVVDGWSLAILRREMIALYTAARRREPSTLVPLAVQYADFARWQRQWFEGPLLAAQLAYWRQRLAGLQPLELPLDRPRPVAGGEGGAARRFHWPATLASALRDLARRHGATLFMVLLAGFLAQLARLSGQRDVAVGVPVANRGQRELEALIGFFVNMVVLRQEVPAELRFVDFLARVREAVLAAFGHQDLPFEKLVEELQPDRDLGRNPLFQVCFQVFQAPQEEVEDLTAAARGRAAPGEPVAGATTVRAGAKFDLHLALSERGTVLAGFLEYATDLFDDTTIRRLLAGLETQLTAVVAAPQQPLGALPVLPAAERHQLLVEWNDSAGGASASLLHTLVAQQAVRFPHRVALEQGEVRWTYAELMAASQRLARRLEYRLAGSQGRSQAAAAGGDKVMEPLVGVLLERSPEMVVTLLAILQVGGAYLPLDADYPTDRLAMMLADAGEPVVVTRAALRPRLPAAAAVVELDQPAAALAPPRPPVTGDPNRLAYVMYTSGSTGRPKGVAVPHRAVVRLVWGSRFARLAADEVFLLAAPSSFDASTFELWGALVHGARLVLLPPGRTSLEDLGAVVEKHGVSTLWLTAALLQQMVEGPLERLSGVRQLLAGGDVLPVAAVETLLRRLPGTRLINGYGPTENTTFTCCQPVTPGSRLRPSVPIGRPIADTRVQVLDGALEPVAIGVVGELFTSGAGLARGYLGRPALTAERFQPDDLAAVAGARRYAIGDLGRYLAGGELEFLGRRDHQVKVRGHRIELGEIAATLEDLPGVAAAVAVVHGARLEEQRIIAYVVPAAAAHLDRVAWAAGLRLALRQTLPEFMLPNALEVLDELPLGASGKVDRRALPEPQGLSGPANDQGRGPQGPVEEVLAGHFAEVLGRTEVGAHSDFFDLGGHSLLATRLISRVRTTFELELPIAALFESPSVASLAGRIEAELAAAEGLVIPPLEPLVSRRGAPAAAIPLSFAQERLWFLDQLEPDSTLYVMPLPVRVQGPVDAVALAAALSEILRRHESLRTCFPGLDEVDHRPYQEITAARPLVLPRLDLRALPSARQEEESARLARREAHRPFDLRRAPMLRATLVQRGPEDHVLLLALHHIASDAWSMDVLLGELMALYRAGRDGQPSPLPDLPVQYADFAVWQRAWLQGEALAAQINYWRRALAGHAMVLDLPTDRPRPAQRTPHGQRSARLLSTELSDALRSLARRAGATLFMVFMAAFQMLLGRWSRQDDVLVGTTLANRGRAELEGLIGFFVNTLVLRGRLTGAAPFHRFLAQVRATALAAYGHQDLPFERLVEALEPERDLGRHPVFQVMLSLHNTTAAAPAPPAVEELRFSVLGSGRRVALFDLNVDVYESPAGLVASFEYSTDLFDGTTVERLGRQMETLLYTLVESVEEPLDQLPLLPAAERHQLLHEWNDTASAAPRVPWTTLFKSRVEAAPQAPAVRFLGHQLSYRELARRGHLLAHHLRALGAGPEVVVAILLERGLHLPVAIVGTLAAGAAYLPLDPDHPLERQLFMLRDSGARMVITVGGGRPELAAEGVQVLCLEAAAEEIEAYPATPPTPSPGLDHLAYVIYTSGSTGRPKGTMIDHRSLASYSLAAVQAFALRPADRILQFAALSFDVAVEELFPTWLAGATLVLAGAERLQSPATFLSVVEEEGLTGLELPTAFWHPWVEHLATQGLRLPAALRFVIIGGERVVRQRLEQWRRLGVPLLHVYGLTETTVTSTLYAVPQKEEAGAAGRELPIGRPLEGSQVLVCDHHLRPVPMGVAGEVLVAGAFVGRGYLRRPALTAERFVPDPAGRGGRLYRTGDLARQRADGNLEFVGRLDHQVKVRGFRIEPGEVESALEAHEGVGEAIVAVREVAGDRRLVAWWTAAGRAAEEPPGSAPSAAASPPVPLSVSALRAWLRRRLPEHMVPSSFLCLDALPRSANGKIDRRALPTPGDERPDLGAGYVAPHGALEESVAAVFGQVLGLERVGRDDDFFDLGGHSLLATQVVSRLRQKLGLEISLRRLFEAPTVRQLALGLEGLEGPGEALESIPRVDSAAPARLSFAQERLWFIDQLEGGSGLYNVPTAVSLHGPLDSRSLDRALVEVARRHQVLRTTFDDASGQPLARVGPVPQHLLHHLDLRALAQAVAEDEGRRQIGREVKRGFDLAAGPVWRALLLTLRVELHVLLLNLHHIVTDGWAMAVLEGEIKRLYAAFSTGRRSPLAEPTVQYAAFAAWQRRRLEGERMAAEVAHWRARLGDAGVVLALPSDRPRPREQTFRGQHLPVVFGAPLSAAFEALAKSHGASLFMTLLALFAAQLGRLSGQSLVRIGTPVAGRTRVETEGVIGLFVNTLVESVDLAGDPTFEELLVRVREVVLDADAHQDLPFEKLVDAVQPERDLGRSPLFQVMLNFEQQSGGGGGHQEAPSAGVEFRPYGFELPMAKFELTLALMAAQGGVRGVLEYNTDLFDASTVRRWGGQLLSLAAEVVAHPQRRLAALHLLPAAARHQLLVEAGPEASAGPSTLTALLERRSALAPEAVAVVHGGEHLSLGCLALGAARLAGRLLRLQGTHLRSLPGSPIGRTPVAGGLEEARVAVLAQRGVGMVTALWGVLAAGGAYVPLDPALPAERLNHVVDDSAIAALVVSGVEVPAWVSQDVPILRLEDGREGEPSTARPAISAQQLAYVIYTSGSTGRPKGVQVEHGTAARFLRAMAERPGLGADDDLLAVTTLGFDIALLEVFLPLMVGARVVIAEQEEALAGDRLSTLLAAHRIRAMQATPTTWELLLAEGWRPGGGFKVLCGGEALPLDLARRLLAGDGELWNLYGPTETTVWSSALRLRSLADGVVLGPAIAGSRLLVLDRFLRPLPLGVVGELCIAGGGVARGYLGRPALTAERFVADAQAGTAGQRLYRSGDLVRQRADGSFEFLGRFDHQVKVRGFRIELGEIEARLDEHPAVQRALAAVHGEGAEPRRLLAYVVPKVAAAQLDGAALRDFLRAKLPAYMVPAEILQLAELPLNSSGKVDRKALPAPGQATATTSRRPHLGPRNDLERQLAAIWQEVLQVDRVGVHDNFFDLGGHSLLMVQVRNRIRDLLGRQTSLLDLFRHPNLSGLAEHLAGGKETRVDSEGSRRRAQNKRQALAGRRRPPGRGRRR